MRPALGATGTVTGAPLRQRPAWIRVSVAAAAVVVGALLATRPFTSLSVLVWLVAAASVATGALRWVTARATAARWDGAVALGWVALGVVVAAWPDLSVRGIAIAAGLGMVAGGLSDLVGGLRGSVDERMAAVLRGAASVVLGVLALSWPDVTVLVVAVLFGARTVLFGLAELLSLVTGRTGAEAPRPRGRVRRFGRVVTSAAALVAALLLASVSATLREGEPTIDAFYSAPDDLPRNPGQLLRAERFTRTIPDDADAWRILYTTTTADGEVIAASGLVVAPARRGGGPTPVVAWAHGTTGVDPRCAPTLLDDPLGAGAFFALDRVLAEGWVLVAPDYAGLGAGEGHPYLVGEPSARSVLDAVRASRQLDELDLADDTVVWGHSQGGGVALWSGQIAPTYAPDVGVLAVAALAPASDTANLAGNLAVIPGGSLFASYVLEGYAAAYDDVRVEDYVEPTARITVDALAERCLGEPAVLVSLLESIATGFDVFRRDLREGPLGDRLAENVPAGPYEVPVLIGQGATDPLVLPDVQAAFADRLCEEGNLVDYRAYEGRDHVGVVAADSPLLPELVEWTADRFTGAVAESTCAPSR